MIDEPRVPAPGNFVRWLRRRRDFNLVIAIGAGKPLDDARTFSWHVAGAQLVPRSRLITRDINGIYCCQNWSLGVVAWTE